MSLMSKWPRSLAGHHNVCLWWIDCIEKWPLWHEIASDEGASLGFKQIFLRILQDLSFLQDYVHWILSPGASLLLHRLIVVASVVASTHSLT